MNVATTSSKQTAPLTFDELLTVMDKFAYLKQMPKTIKVAPDVMDFLNDHFGEDNKMVATLYGIDVLIDEDLETGEWKVVRDETV